MRGDDEEEADSNAVMLTKLGGYKKESNFVEKSGGDGRES